ncbi:MAG: alpha/beta hydrolase [Saprospiraceae bacterium]|nr:alpha/beta hydrolase [Saprospiraceae bacterium]
MTLQTEKITSKLFTQDIFISQLQRNRTTRILLPEAYYKYPDKRFPVMYLMDGQNLFDASTAYFQPWNVQKAMDSLPLKDQIILVGIDNGGHYRGSEYLPHHHHPLYHHGEGDKFVDFIVSELKPKVDHHLRTLTDRENTFIAGSSLGGLISFYAATRWSHIFGKAGVMSPAFWVYPQVLNFKPGQFSKIYVMGSKTESRGMSKTLEKTYRALRDKGYPEDSYRVIIKDRGKHSEKMWGSQFSNMLKWLIK